MIADAAVSGSSKGVDHSKSTCSGEDIWKGPAKISVDKTRYMHLSTTKDLLLRKFDMLYHLFQFSFCHIVTSTLYVARR